ncbi:hypothetical protein Avbf_13736 [Armadillidium vulgare]|nr:hypothetical protein Avbf_13736 [Armadillidium vulgare]
MDQSCSTNETAGPTPLNLSTSQILTIEFSILMCSVILGSSCISNVLLIIGAAKKLLYFLIPWLVLQWISLFTLMGILGVTLWQLILAGSVGRYWGLLMFGIGVLILLLIALLFVLSLYQVIRDQEVPEIRPDIELMNRQLWIPKQHRYFD